MGITHCGGCIGLKIHMHASSCWCRDSLLLILMINVKAADEQFNHLLVMATWQNKCTGVSRPFLHRHL